MTTNSSCPDDKALKLLIAGNTSVPGMINAIISATLQARKNTANESKTFNQIHIFHTEQSIDALIKADKSWQESLRKYRISHTSLIHHVTKVEDTSEEQFSELVEQLKTVVNPLNNTGYYVDLTNGISSLKSMLTVFAYVLDINHIYLLETRFTDRSQRAWFYDDLIRENISMEYKRFPPLKGFDNIGNFNYTNVIRYKELIQSLTQSLEGVLPSRFDLKYLQSSLLSGLNLHLRGQATNSKFDHQHSVFSASSAVEQLACIILESLGQDPLEEETLGDKLSAIRDVGGKSPKYFIDVKILNHLTKLIRRVRNNVAHASSKVTNPDEDVESLNSYLFTHISIVFIQFITKSLSSFSDGNGELQDVRVLQDADLKEEDKIYFFGIDGDSTGDYLEAAFGESLDDEKEVIKRSKEISKALFKLKGIIRKSTRSNDSVILAEGDNILFKGKYDPVLLACLQKEYREITRQTTSIGYGATLREASIALRLAKAQQGDSIIGVGINSDGRDNIISDHADESFINNVKEDKIQEQIQ